MLHFIKYPILFITFFVFLPSLAHAQVPEGLSDRYIRVAEIGELVDSVNVWGDVNSAGRYLVPEGTNLPDLISFSFGTIQPRVGSGDVNWSKRLYEIKVSRYNERNRAVEVAYFRYRYYDPEPIEMYEFDLQNNDIVTVQIKQMPSFVDYVRVVGPIISIVGTSLLLIERLR